MSNTEAIAGKHEAHPKTFDQHAKPTGTHKNKQPKAVDQHEKQPNTADQLGKQWDNIEINLKHR